MTETTKSSIDNRRRFLKRAATGGVTAGALAAPMLVKAQAVTSLRFQQRTSSTSTRRTSPRRSMT